MRLLILLLAIINIVTFCTYGIDKWKAQHNKWRISELTLFVFALIGGSIGALLGMSIFHHKTQHLKFKIGIPVILAVQVIVFMYFLFKY